MAANEGFYSSLVWLLSGSNIIDNNNINSIGSRSAISGSSRIINSRPSSNSSSSSIRSSNCSSRINGFTCHQTSSWRKDMHRNNFLNDRSTGSYGI